MDKAAPPGEIVYGRIESGLCRLRPSDDFSKAEKILANGALPESLTSGTAPAVPGGGASLSEVARFHLKLGIRPGFERRFLRMSFEKRFPAFARGTTVGRAYLGVRILDCCNGDFEPESQGLLRD